MGFFCLKNDTLSFLVHPIPSFLLLLVTELFGYGCLYQCFSPYFYLHKTFAYLFFLRNNLTTWPNAIHLIDKFDDACIVFIQNLIARFTKDFSIACVISL